MNDPGVGTGANSYARLVGDFAFEERPRTADVIWSQGQWELLAFHLHNQNDEYRFVIGFNGNEGPSYRRNKSRRVRQAVSWAWSTIIGRAKSPLAFAPYSQNARGASRWAVLDIDAHDRNYKRAEKLALAAFGSLRNHGGLFLILETSGNSGGWHVWAIARDFRPVEEWKYLLWNVCEKIGTRPRAGECEIFPTYTERSEYGRAVRMPGSWNPKGGFSEIVFENVSTLLNMLTPRGENDAPLPALRGESGNSRRESGSEFPEKRKKLSFPAPRHVIAPLYAQWEKKWCTQYAITKFSTRNAKIGSLTGAIFHQVGRKMAERIATEQFKEKSVATRANLHEHLADFSNYWNGLEVKWRARLSEAEERFFNDLGRETYRDAFRIVRNFAQLCDGELRDDFPIARDDLAGRLGLTGAGAGKIRLLLCKIGIIRLVKEYQPNSRAARYIWITT